MAISNNLSTISYLTFTSELSSTPSIDDSENAGTLVGSRWYVLFTIPSTYSLAQITGVGWKNGTAIAGNITCGIDIITENPPTTAAAISLGITQEVAQAGINSAQRSNFHNSILIPGGTLIGIWISFDNASAKWRRKTTGVAAYNSRKIIAYTVNPARQDTTAWSTSTLEGALTIYYKGIY